MQLSGIDLNLAVILQALIETRSITLASRKLGLSQSATSHALGRLRALLDDPLLLRSGRGVIPTPRALQIAAGLSAGLSQIERSLFAKTEFHPATEARSFRLIAGDFAELLLIPELIATLSRQAPQIDMWFESPGDNQFERLAQGTVDALIGVAPRRADDRTSLRYQSLFTDSFVSIVRKGHPLLKGPVTAHTFAAQKHAFVAPGGRPGGVVDTALAEHGLHRRVALGVPHFLVAPHVVAKSDLVLTIGRRLAEMFVRIISVEMIEPPIQLPSFELGLYWHARNENDLAHRYLRQTLTEIASGLAPSVPPLKKSARKSEKIRAKSRTKAR